MKKLILTSYLLSMVALFGFAQSLSLSNADGTLAPNCTIIHAGTPDSVELITYLYVKNISGNPLEVFCKKHELSMLDSTEITMCWAGNCYPSNVFISPGAEPIAAGETNTEFIAHYTQTAFSHFKSGESVVRWVFYSRSDPNDSASVTVKYTSYPLGIGESDARAGLLSNIFPNPASGDAGCNYSIPAGMHGELLIRDIVGKSVQTRSLPSTAGIATFSTSDLGNGIYFCSLLVDGKVTQTKKLVVKH